MDAPQRRLGTALFATALAVAVPATVALLLREGGLVTSLPLLALLAAALSLTVSRFLAALWQRRGHGDLVFAELMLWGWLRRRRFERQLDRSAALVGPGAAGGLDAEQRARTLERLSRALEARDPRTHGHSRRVARHAAAVSRRLGLTRRRVATVRLAALLHDVGKIETPTRLLDKPGPLSAAEYEVVKRHVASGRR